MRQLNSNYDHISSIATLIGCLKEVYTAGCGMLISVSTTLAHTHIGKNGVSYFRFIFPHIDNVSERFYINAFLFCFVLYAYESDATLWRSLPNVWTLGQI